MHVHSQVLAEGGYSAFLFRGLGTKIFSNAVQGVCFTVFWQLFQEWFARRGARGKGAAGQAGQAGRSRAGAHGGAAAGQKQDGRGEVAVAADRRGGAASSRGARGHSREREGGAGAAVVVPIPTQSASPAVSSAQSGVGGGGAAGGGGGAVGRDEPGKRSD